MSTSIVNDPRPKLKQQIESAEKDIARLESCIIVEWRAIKDFVHSFEKTEDAQKRIEKMKSDIGKHRTFIRKQQAKLNKFKLPEWAK